MAKIIIKTILTLAILTLSIYSNNLTKNENKNIKIFNNTKDSVVFISTQESVIDYNTLNKYTIPKGSGSGFIWDKLGHIVTNYHVIEGSNSAKVKLRNGKVYYAKLVGLYPRRDIAVLKIDAPKELLKPVKIGDSENLKVGQEVYAIGNPYGLDWTMTKGIVSALNRQVPLDKYSVMSKAIQTDAAINPGNSGGVMLNSSGEVIGVNSAIFSPSGGSVGIGFAIPINIVKKVVSNLIKYGKYTKPSIGIETDDRINSSLKDALGVRGVAVLGVLRESDAYKKGLKSATFYSDGSIDFGDIITAINGKKIKNVYDLDDILDTLKIGSVVNLEILRGKDKINIPIKLIGLDN